MNIHRLAYLLISEYFGYLDITIFQVIILIYFATLMALYPVISFCKC